MGMGLDRSDVLYFTELMVIYYTMFQPSSRPLGH